MNAFKVKNDIYWTGVLDPDLETFDVIMKTPYGSTYNSYFINDEKKVLIDTVKPNFKDEFISKLASMTDIEAIDIVVINHTEPDHSGCLKYILEINPRVVVYCTKAASIFLAEQINGPFNCHVVSDNELLDIGKRKLKFITTPFLHWSDTMFVYSELDEVIFTCDGFGSHYASLNPQEVHKDEYKDSLKLYYNAIMKPFAQHYLNAHKKIESLHLDMILPSHGPILSEDPQYNMDRYYQWSKNQVAMRKDDQVALIYVSAYRNTELMAEKIKEGLEAAGVNVVYLDAEKESIEKIHDAINSSKGLILGSPTINRTMIKPIWDVLSVIDPMANMGKVGGIFGSYGWGGEGINMAYTLLRQMGYKVPLEALSKKFTPSEATLEKCVAFGKDFAGAL